MTFEDEESGTVQAVFCTEKDQNIQATLLAGTVETEGVCADELELTENCGPKDYVLKSCVVARRDDTTEVRFEVFVDGCDCETVSRCDRITTSVSLQADVVPGVCSESVETAETSGKTQFDEACNEILVAACQESLSEECSSRKQASAKTVNDTCSSQLVQSKEKCSKESDASQVDSVKKKNAAVGKVEEECQVRMSGACGKL